MAEMKAIVSGRRIIADGIVELRLCAADGGPMPAHDPGDHLELHTPSGQSRRYSLTAGDAREWTIAVALHPGGAGGSRSIHEKLSVGERIVVDGPHRGFPLHDSDRYLFLAGGIGITVIRSLYRAAKQRGALAQLVYLVRSRAAAAYLEEFDGDPDVRVHAADEHGGSRFDLWTVLESPDSSRLYCCGPAGLADEVRALTAHWRASRVHFEDFAGVDAIGDAAVAFEAVWTPTGMVIAVPGDRSLLDALDRRGIAVDSSCRAGTCGSCRLRLVEGQVWHRDLVLSTVERADAIMPCVSRGIGRIGIAPA